MRILTVAMMRILTIEIGFVPSHDISENSVQTSTIKFS